MILKFENSFKICMTALRLLGAHPNTPRNGMWIVKFIFIITLSNTCFIFLINSVVNHDIRNKNYTDAVNNLTIAIIFLTISFKHFVLIRHRNSLMNIIKIIDEDYSTDNELYTLEEEQVVLECSRKGTKICKYWLLIIVLNGAMFPITALFLMACSYYEGNFKLIPMFDLTYPNIINTHKDDIYMYCLLSMLCLFFDIYACFMYIGFDPLIPIFLLHICGQIDILSQRMKNALTGEIHIYEKHKKLKQICKKQQLLNRFLNSLKSCFTELFEINMKNATFMMPFTAIQIIQTLQRLELNLEFMFFFLTGFMNFFIPCYFCNRLMDKGASFREAIYTCNWESQPDIQIRKTVLLMLTRCNVPMSMKTIFYDLNLETFAKMCQQAYVIFNALNTIKSS